MQAALPLFGAYVPARQGEHAPFRANVPAGHDVQMDAAADEIHPDWQGVQLVDAFDELKEPGLHAAHGIVELTLLLR